MLQRLKDNSVLKKVLDATATLHTVRKVIHYFNNKHSTVNIHGVIDLKKLLIK